MKKNIHLICNSHLDPVWQWDWPEGNAAALACFYSAVDLLKDKEFDFVFNHNEVYLYENIEKFEPTLFKDIQELVKQGKWHIMGGTYVQPDAMVPSGESLIRQISLGKEYFKEKFNVSVRTANNFDAFAHTRGLASIYKKCGYDSYIFCRPMWYHDLFSKTPLPIGPFLWKGYDGSLIKCLRHEDYYFTRNGTAKKKVQERISQYPNENNICVLWGIGNHGGGVSRSDLRDLKTLADETKDKYKFIHSTPEQYFNSVNPKTIVSRQLLCFFKSYSSCHNIKQIHDELENALYLTEKICSIADLENVYHYNKDVLKKAEKVLCQIEFHDVLSGTAIKTGTDTSISKAKGAIEDLKQEFFAALNGLMLHLPKVKPGDDNFVLFNPFPYEYNDLVTCEFSAPIPVQELDKQYTLTLYDQKGNEIPHQKIKEESQLNYDRRFRIIFNAKIPACSVISIGIHKEVTKRDLKWVDDNNDIVIKDSVKVVKISRKTGLLESFNVNGKEYLSSPSCVPTLFNDNEDPWGWYINRFDTKTDLHHNIIPYSNAFKAIKLDNKPKGIFSSLRSVTVIEKGDILTEVQALFSHQESKIVINYKIYKDKPYIDISLHTIYLEQKKGLKLKFSLNGSKSYFAQAAFGIENYKADSLEYPCNRYVGVNNDGDALCIYNKSGIHSVSKTGNNLYLTLLNGSVYCAHPIDRDNNEMETDRGIIKDPNRFLPYMEQGVFDFNFRLRVNKLDEVERFAKEFNEPVYALYAFPHGDGKVSKDTVTLTNKNIVITALKRRNDGSFLIRLYNGSNDKASTELAIKGFKKTILFKKFEFKTFVFDQDSIIESKDAGIY